MPFPSIPQPPSNRRMSLTPERARKLLKQGIIKGQPLTVRQIDLFRKVAEEEESNVPLEGGFSPLVERSIGDISF